MNTPKPVAPSKPLSYTPPQYNVAHPRQSAKKITHEHRQAEIGDGITQAIMIEAFQELARDFPEVVAGMAQLGEEARVATEAMKKTNEELEKKPFERKPHLTQRPFLDSPEMRELQRKLNASDPRNRNNRRSNQR